MFKNLDTRAVLDRLIPWNCSLSSCEGGFRRSIFGDYSSLDKRPLISNEELMRIDHRLPSALLLLEKHIANVNGVHVKRMVELWDAPVMVQTIHGTSVAMLHISALDIRNGNLYFQGNGDVVTEHMCEDTGQVIMLNHGSDAVFPIVASSWMDAKAPGWDNKLAIANNLGLSLTDAMQSLLSIRQTVKASVIPEDIVI